MNNYFKIYLKVNQVVYSSIRRFIRFQGSSFNSFSAALLTRFQAIFFSKGHNSGKGHNPVEKKIRVSYFFFMMNPFKNFQNSSMHASKVMLCIKKSVTNGRTNGLTDERPISNIPLQFLRSCGHKKKYTYSSGKSQCSSSYRK